MQAPANDLQLIERKRDGKELSDQQIRSWSSDLLTGRSPTIKCHICNGRLFSGYDPGRAC